jgi:diketogulonate reductase-like aldo/keto reductase
VSGARENHKKDGCQGWIIAAYFPLGLGSLLHHPALKEIARKHGKNPAQVALRWLIDQDGVIAIPKAATTQHLRANIDIFDFALDNEDRVRLNKTHGPGFLTKVYLRAVRDVVRARAKRA